MNEKIKTIIFWAVFFGVIFGLPWFFSRDDDVEETTSSMNFANEESVASSDVTNPDSPNYDYNKDPDLEYDDWLKYYVEDMEWLRAEGAIDAVGYKETVCDYAISVSYRDDIEGSPAFINLGADYPGMDRCQIVIWGNTRDQFEEFQDLSFLEYENTGEAIAVTGDIEEYDGVAQIEVTDPEQIQIVEPT